MQWYTYAASYMYRNETKEILNSKNMIFAVSSFI